VIALASRLMQWHILPMAEILRRKKERLAELKVQVRLLEDEIRYLTVHPNGDAIKVPELPEPAKDVR